MVRLKRGGGFGARRGVLRRDAARHVATKTVGSVIDGRNVGKGGGTRNHHLRPRRGAIAHLVGEVSSVANALPNQRGVIKTIGSHRWGREGQITTRHAASLRPPRNGRIWLKPPFSKRGAAEKSPHGFNLLWRGLFTLAMKNVSIKHLQLFEDRSDATCRIVVKTIGAP